MNMMAVLAMRLREFTLQIESLSLKEVPGRLASYLMYLSKEEEYPDKITLAISKGQLASLLGTIPETLSRILTKMNQYRIIEVDGRDIQIVDHDKLQELAENGKLN